MKAGVDGVVYAFATTPTGVFVAGSFDHASEVLVHNIYFSNGTTGITPMSGGLPNCTIFALAYHRNTNRLYIGGNMTIYNNLQLWDGVGFSDVGPGLQDGPVYALTLHPTMNELLIGGSFITQDALENGCINVVNYWISSGNFYCLAQNVSSIAIYALAYDQNLNIYAGGNINGTLYYVYPDQILTYASNIAVWKGTQWYSLNGTGPNHHVKALLIDNSTFPTNLVVGGLFNSISELPIMTSSIARYFYGNISTQSIITPNSTTLWESVATSAIKFRELLHVQFDATQQKLWIAGQNLEGGSVAFKNSTTDWLYYGTGVYYENDIGNAAPRTLLLDKSSERKVVVGGNFERARNADIYITNVGLSTGGQDWNSMSLGIASLNFREARVNTLAFDQQTRIVYAGGKFSPCGTCSNNVNNIAFYNLNSPSNLWAPISNGTNGEVFALTLVDSGSVGMFVGGDFTRAGIG